MGNTDNCQGAHRTQLRIIRDKKRNGISVVLKLCKSFVERLKCQVPHSDSVCPSKGQLICIFNNEVFQVSSDDVLGNTGLIWLENKGQIYWYKKKFQILFTPILPMYTGSLRFSFCFVLVYSFVLEFQENTNHHRKSSTKRIAKTRHQSSKMTIICTVELQAKLLITLPLAEEQNYSAEN